MSLGLIHATHGRVAILGWMPVECGLDPGNKNLREVKHSQKGHEEEDRAWQIKGRAGVCCKLKPMDQSGKQQHLPNPAAADTGKKKKKAFT